MGSVIPVGEAAVGSDAPREKGKATAETLRTGCIAWVEKEGQPRRAEILSIKETKSGKHFYCNFDNFNKRLDEWVPVTRIDFKQDVEWPNPEKDKLKQNKSKRIPAIQTKKSAVSKKTQKRPAKREQSVFSDAPTPHPWTGAPISMICGPGTSADLIPRRIRRVSKSAEVFVNRTRWRPSSIHQH